MADLLRKLMDISLGVAAITREKTEAVVDELVKRGELSRDAGDKVVDELVQKGEEARGELSKTIETKIEEIVHRLNLATKDELAELAMRVAELERGPTAE